MLKKAPGSLRVISVALSAVVGLFGIGLVLARYADADHGTTPDWVAATATLAAFGAAIVAGWYAHRALRVEQERDRLRDEQATRAQAELVAAWSDAGSVTTDDTPWRGGERREVPRVRIRNASNLPVLNFRAAVSARTFTGREQRVRIIGRIDVPIVPPGANVEAHAFPADMLAALKEIQSALPTGGVIVLTVGVVFTDAGGRHWIRQDNGRLDLAPDVIARERETELPI